MFASLPRLPRAQWGAEAVAGATLAALAIPEVLGYAHIAGMPVVTGLYTMLLPTLVFVLLCSSRHLVVGADSATAAMLASGLTGLAVAGSDRYVALAGTIALVVGLLLLIARVIRLGFLANFLSRTVLVGFLTGVGLQVALGQLGDMLGLDAGRGSLPQKLWTLARSLGSTQLPTLAVAATVLAAVIIGHFVKPRFPTALIAVLGAILAAHLLNLPRHGVAVIGQVHGGLPLPSLPSLALSDLRAALPIAASMVVVILAQSAATSRAYAVRFDENVNTDDDLAALGGANLAAAVTGTFVVNGSPTKTQIVVGAGGRSQWSQLVTVAVVLLACLFGARLLADLPLAALAAVVFMIGVDLIDLAGMRGILAVRRDEFVVAVLTAAAVVLLGVQTGIVIAVLVSILDHLRHSYSPRSTVLRKSPQGHWLSLSIEPGLRTTGGLVVYRFGSGLYFANVARFVTDLTTIASTGPAVRWLCLDAAAIGDIDYTASAVLQRLIQREQTAGMTVVFSNVMAPVRAELDKYGLSALVGTDGFYDTSGEALAAYEASTDGSTETGR